MCPDSGRQDYGAGWAQRWAGIGMGQRAMGRGIQQSVKLAMGWSHLRRLLTGARRALMLVWLGAYGCSMALPLAVCGV